MHRLRFLPTVLLLLAGILSGFAGTRVRFHTTVGDMDVELFDADKPMTVQNFLTYVQGDYYTNMFMHRVVPGFVIQGGGFDVTGFGTTHEGVGDVTTLAPITNEFNVGPFYSNLYGTIAMAKTSDPDSATSQFFFNLADNSVSLDDTNNAGGFTVFGQVVAGTNVLNRFLVGGTNNLVKQANLGGAFNELPILYSADPNNVTFGDLVYVDIGNLTTPPKAIYNGLSALAPDPTNGVPGFITLATTAGSKLSGSLRLGTARYTFSGAFNAVGHAVVSAKSGRLPPLLLRLHTDLVLGADKLVGTLSGSNWVTEVSAYRAGFDGFTVKATDYLGKYTMTVSNGITGGLGVAALSVNPAGRASVRGSLADGTAFAQSVPVSGAGHWPLYASLTGGKGSCSAWMSFTSRDHDDLNGTGLWFKPAQGTAKAYPQGFTNDVSIVGTRYTPPTLNAPLLSLTNYQISFSGGSVAVPFANGVRLKGSQLLNTSPNKLTVSVAVSSGLFSGNVKPPGSLVGIPFKGALLQKQDSGFGYFLGAGQSGQVWLHQ
jgi:peptidyl-prolyl cis-trans isomerase A (cyclophilin A)